jgi:hypothetical protein
MKTARESIGGNGFTINVDVAAEIQLSDVKINQRQLAINADKLSKVVNQLNRILQTMPEELYQGFIGEAVRDAGNLINNAAGIVGAAHDQRLQVSA